jgi:hypothetical protein
VSDIGLWASIGTWSFYNTKKQYDCFFLYVSARIILKINIEKAGCDGMDSLNGLNIGIKRGLLRTWS